MYFLLIFFISSSSDKKTDAGLNRRDLSGRPFGAVFNLHKDYSKIFVGGYPFDAGVQRTMQSTNMNGQIESLKIGKEVQIKLNYCKKVFFFLIHLFSRDVLVMKKKRNRKN
jgi:hypothetical protein